jgi:hypothetical protein
MKCIVLDTLHCRPPPRDGGEGAWARVGLFATAAAAAAAV